MTLTQIRTALANPANQYAYVAVNKQRSRKFVLPLHGAKPGFYQVWHTYLEDRSNIVSFTSIDSYVRTLDDFALVPFSDEIKRFYTRDELVAIAPELLI